MAIIYLRSTDGNDADNGSTWALAKATLAGAVSAASAGDTIYVSQAHAESTGANVFIVNVGTTAAPLKVICVSDSAEPPTTLATTGVVENTGDHNINFFAGVAYIYGLTFKSATGGSAGAGTTDITIASTGFYVVENCDFYLNSTGSSTLNFGGGIRKNCRVHFGDPTQKIETNGIVWTGGSFISGTSTPNAMFGALQNTTNLIENVDMSNLSSTVSLTSAANAGFLVFRNCKLPSSWSGSVYAAAPSLHGNRHSVQNCDSANTNYYLWTEDVMGSVKHETTLVKTGGASDGVTPISWKIVTTANADDFPASAFVTDEIVRWNDTTGSSITVTVDILHDSVTNLTNGEIWVEVNYLGTSGNPLGVFVSDAKADILASAADQDASGATWTTTGMTNPNKQKLVVSFTPTVKGFIHAAVRTCKPSKTIYVDPVLQVS